MLAKREHKYQLSLLFKVEVIYALRARNKDILKAVKYQISTLKTENRFGLEIEGVGGCGIHIL